MDQALGIVLAGSHAWRGSSFEELSPRPLVSVAFQPLVSYVLRWLSSAGIQHATLCCNGSSESVRRQFGEGQGAWPKLDYYKDSNPRGAAGCARDAALRTAAEVFVIADGSVIPRVDLVDVIRRHRESGAVGTVVVEAHPTEGSVQPDSPVGIYVFSREALSLVPCAGFQDIKETLIPRLYRDGYQVLSYRSAMWTPRVLDSTSYLAVNHWATAEAVNGRIELPGYAPLPARPSCVAHETVRVDPSAMIVGPVLLGAGVQVMANSVIIGPATIESGAMICAGAVVSRSVVGPESIVGVNAFLDRSVLGTRAHIAAGEQVTGSVRLPSQEFVARIRPKRLGQLLSRRLDPAFSTPA